MTTTISVRTDKEVKDNAECVLDKLGLNLSTAVNIFLRQIVRENGIPFDVKLDIPNKETKKAIEEGDRLVANKKTKRYNSVDELRKDLNV